MDRPTDRPTDRPQAEQSRNKLRWKRLTAESLHAFERAVESDPYHADAHVYLAKTMAELDEYAAARASYKAAYALQPLSVAVMNGMGIVNAQEGRMSEAAQLFAMAVQLARDRHV